MTELDSWRIEHSNPHLSEWQKPLTKVDTDSGCLEKVQKAQGKTIQEKPKKSLDLRLFMVANWYLPTELVAPVISLSSLPRRTWQRHFLRT